MRQSRVRGEVVPVYAHDDQIIEIHWRLVTGEIVTQLLRFDHGNSEQHVFQHPGDSTEEKNP